MKICVLSSGHTVDDSRVFHKEIISLKKSYNDISLVCPDNKKYCVKDGIKIFGIRKRKSRYNRLSTLLDLYKTGLKINADIYHCHEPDSLFIGWFLKKKLGCKLIYDCHEFHPEAFSEDLPPGLRGMINFIVEKFENIFAAQCDYIFTVNNLLVKRFLKISDNVLYLPNYPVLKPLQDINFDSRDKDLVYVGGLSEENGIFEIIKSINILRKEVPEIKLSLIGDFTNKFFRDKILNYINNNQLDSRIMLTGYISHQSALDILTRKSIGLSVIQPRNDRQINCQPIKLFEYMKCGNCILASNFPVIKEIIEKYDCGALVNPQSPEEIATAIKEILNNSNRLREQMENSRKAAENEYKWESLEVKLLEAYESLRTKSRGIYDEK